MRFITDTHLGKLAKYLRLLGFDTLHFKEGDDETLEQIARDEERILLTRDRALYNWAKAECYFPINIDTDFQVKEILEHFHLCEACRPFTRCMICNGMVEELSDTSSILHLIPPKVKEFNTRYWQCQGCGKIYWHGTHYEKMKQKIDAYCSKGLNRT